MSTGRVNLPSDGARQFLSRSVACRPLPRRPLVFAWPRWPPPGTSEWAFMKHGRRPRTNRLPHARQYPEHAASNGQQLFGL
jgi:hypothetical protein